MTKYKTNDQDIIDLIKYGNLGYMDLVQHVENTYDLDGLFHFCNFGYNDSDCMNYDGTINLFPFFNYKLQFSLYETTNKPTKVMFARGNSTFRDIKYHCPTMNVYKTTTNITSRDKFVGRLVAWHKFVNNSKIAILENSENYIKELDQSIVDYINEYLMKYRFNYTVSLESMHQSYYNMLETIDYTMDEIKSFRKTDTEMEIE